MNTWDKRRKWVKPAAISFFVLMLLLTFFSNTILNWSLPEVSTCDVSGGTITAKVMGSAVVEETEAGPIARFVVSAEMAARFMPGDQASLMGVRLPREAAAVLRSKEAKAGDLSRTELVFDIQNVSVGSAVYITLGDRGTAYSAVVPNSALRQDVNGLYVLTLRESRTPLGNRYVAERVNVTLLDRDDVCAAVSGGVSEGDTVIVNTSRPLEPGTQVKLA